MAGSERTATLLGQIQETREALAAICGAYDRFMSHDFQELGKRDVTASRLCDILEHYYTCIETLFLRISRFFENDLAKDRWHQDLLDKMFLEVPGVRTRVVARATRDRLLELLRFRHFRRYYYDLEYDWGKIEVVRKKLVEVMPMVNTDLDGFTAFVKAL